MNVKAPLSPADIAEAQSLSDPARLRAMAANHLNDPEAVAAFDRYAHLASRLLNTPVALVSFVDDRAQYFKGAFGLTGEVAETRETPLDSSFCKHVVATGRPLRVVDSHEAEKVRDNGAICTLGVVAYLGVPVRGPSGHVKASLCVIDHRPRDWSTEDQTILEELVSGVEAELRLRQALRDRQLMIEEMNHRVKNLFSLVSGIMRTSRRDFDTAEELAESFEARLGALSKAQKLVVPMAAAAEQTLSDTTLDALIETLMKPYVDPNNRRIAVDGPNTPVGSKSAIYVALALHELATNATKYGALATPDGRLEISWTEEDGDLVLDWRESGLTWEDVSDKPSSGFGSRLLQTCVEGQLLGRMTTEIREDCYHRTIHCALSTLAS